MKRLLTIREACQVTSLSRTTLWQKIRDGRFPRPISLDCGRRAFLASEIEEWIDARLAERNAMVAK